MDEATKTAKQQLLANYQDRLMTLRQRQARMLDKTPADVANEINMLEQSVASLKQELDDHGPDPSAAFNAQAAMQSTYNPDIKGDNIIVGDVHGTGVIVGKSLKTMNYSGPGAEIQTLLQPIEQLTDALTGENKAEADRQYVILAGEVAKGTQADDKLLATAITTLYRIVPGMGGPIVAAFRSPVLANCGGRATWMALGAITTG